VQEAAVMLSPRQQLPPLTPTSGSSALGRARSAGLSTPPQVRGLEGDNRDPTVG
jgi:hypothetical protein